MIRDFPELRANMDFTDIFYGSVGRVPDENSEYDAEIIQTAKKIAGELFQSKKYIL